MKIPVIDLHADTYARKTFFRKNRWLNGLYAKKNDKFIKITEAGVINPKRLNKGNVKVQVQSLFIGNGEINNALHAAMTAISLIKQDCKSEQNYFQVYDSVDIEKNLTNSKTGILISIEGLEVIENNFDLLDIYHALGVRLIAPTWNRILPYNAPMNTDYGLFTNGEELIKKINELGFVLDVSHSSEKSFFEYLKLTKVPIIASHSNIKALNPHPRNLSDDQLRALNDRKGLFGINFYPNFMKPKNYRDDKNIQSGFEWFYRIVEYVATHFSIDIIGIGSDYDGITDIAPNLESPEKFPELADYLLKKGVKKEEIEKIFYKNALRVLKELEK